MQIGALAVVLYNRGGALLKRLVHVHSSICKYVYGCTRPLLLCKVPSALLATQERHRPPTSTPFTAFLAALHRLLTALLASPPSTFLAARLASFPRHRTLGTFRANAAPHPAGCSPPLRRAQTVHGGGAGAGRRPVGGPGQQGVLRRDAQAGPDPVLPRASLPRSPFPVLLHAPAAHERGPRPSFVT